MNMTNDPRPSRHDLYVKMDRPPSRMLKISPNLVAALEYDERTRALTDPSLSPGLGDGFAPISYPMGPQVAGGLPPPPRAKSAIDGTRKVKSPPTSPLLTQIRSIPQSPNLPETTPPASATKPSAWNPYINPAPKSPYLASGEKAVQPKLRSDSDTALYSPMQEKQQNSPTGSSTFSHSSKNSWEYCPSPTVSAPSDAATPNGSLRGRGHRRYFSALPKVDKIFSKGKMVIGNARRSESTSCIPVRRASEAEVLGGCQNLVHGVHPVMRQCGGVFETNTSTTAADSGFVVTNRTRIDDTLQGRSPGEASGGASGSAPVARRTSRNMPDAGRNTEPVAPKSETSGRLISHGRQDLAMSTTTAARSFESARTELTNSSHSKHFSESSHEPPSTPSETRISISSTIYPPDSAYSHSFDNHYYFPQGRSSMSPDRESFIELASPTFSPTFTDFVEDSHNDRHYAAYSRSRPKNSSSSTKPELPKLSTTSVNKPPLPTTPKPQFKHRPQSVQPPAQRSSPSEATAGHDFPSKSSKDLPPTTNLLKPQERADLLRKTRKLTQMFGQTPGPEAMAFSQTAYAANPPSSFLPPSSSLASNLAAKRRHQKAAASVSEDPSSASLAVSKTNKAIWPPADGTVYLTLGNRRHSTPLSPQEFSSIDNDFPAGNNPSVNVTDSRDVSDLIEISSVRSGHSQWSGHTGRARRTAEGGPVSPTSFMDLSDEDVLNDGASSIITVETPRANRRAGAPFSPSTPSLLENLSPDELAEEERRRKREKLARLHRFLGSRVPVDLVLAQIDTAIPRSTVAPISAMEPTLKNDPEVRKVWMRRRRSSSAAEFSGSWSDEIDRLKEDLNEREKAINVRRAIKMEKMFGVAPPQTLYHTRHTATSSVGGAAALSSNAVMPSLLQARSTPPQSPIVFAPRNVNQSSYSKSRFKKNQRPGTAESSEPLIASGGDNQQFGHAFSDVYLHYRHSLNSLNDIIDRDDKESLVDLHDYLHGNSSETPLQHFTLQDTPIHITSPTASTSKAERRRSLPSRTSMTSISSEISLASFSVAQASPEPSDFQNRRRRAAKLTQFFGVDYRELMSEILESIEKGLEEESGRGTLQPDEVQDLLQKLRKLKTKRNTYL